MRSLTEGMRMDVEREGLPISVTLIKPSGMHTPFPDHGRNHMGEVPRTPQIVYHPDLAAEAILFAAEQPRRQLYVGGFGFFLSLLARLFPRTTDRIMEATMVRTQQMPGDPDDPASRDNLFEPKKDGEVEGRQDVRVRRRSRLLDAQKHPFAATAIAGAAAGAAALWLWRKPQAASRTLARPDGDA